MKRAATGLIALFLTITGCAGSALAASHPKVDSIRRVQQGSVCQPTDLFCDDFNGSTLNTAKWNPSWYGGTPPSPGSMTMCTAPSHALVAGGFLDLRLTGESCTVNGHTYPNTGASVDTRGKFAYRNAIIKTRVYFDGDTKGVWQWPAAWSDGTGTWPNTGEADWAEGLSGKLCFHVHTPSGGPGICPSGNYVGWVRIRVVVKNGTTTVSYNGTKVGTLQNVDADQYPVFSAQSGQYGGSPTLPADELVDYIKVRAA